jgi:hypothetical protein
MKSTALPPTIGIPAGNIADAAAGIIRCHGVRHHLHWSFNFL